MCLYKVTIAVILIKLLGFQASRCIENIFGLHSFIIASPTQGENVRRNFAAVIKLEVDAELYAFDAHDDISICFTVDKVRTCGFSISDNIELFTGSSGLVTLSADLYHTHTTDCYCTDSIHIQINHDLKCSNRRQEVLTAQIVPAISIYVDVNINSLGCCEINLHDALFFASISSIVDSVQ